MTCGQVHKTDSLDLPKISGVTLKIYSAGKSQGEFVHSLHWSVIFTHLKYLFTTWFDLLSEAFLNFLWYFPHLNSYITLDVHFIIRDVRLVF